MAKAINSIGDFIDFKYDWNEQTGYELTNEFKEHQENDTDRFNDYPINFIDQNGELKIGFIQDVECSLDIVDGSQIHTIKAIISTSENGYTFRKTCKAPEGCNIEWGNVACAWDLSIE